MLLLIGCAAHAVPSPGDVMVNYDPAFIDSPIDQWVVRYDGIGLIQIGMTASEVESLLGGTMRIDRVEPDETCGQAYFSALPAGVSLMVEATTIVRVDVNAPDVHTSEGIEVGDDEAELLARFQTRLRVEPHHYEGPEGHYLFLDSPESPQLRMIFETDGRVITRYRSGRLPEVDLIEGCL